MYTYLPLHSMMTVVEVGSLNFLQRVKDMLGDKEEGLETAQDIAIRACFVQSRVPDQHQVCRESSQS